MREEKQFLLDEIDEKIEASSGFVVTSYQKMKAALIRDFRDQLGNVGGEFEVVRKRVFLKAAEKRGIKIDPNSLQGHIGIIFAKEEVAGPAKFAMVFGEKNENITILSGLIDGEFLSGEEVKAIATLPSLDELRALFVGLLEAPMAQTLAVINEALAGIPRCLEQKCNKS